MADTVLWNILKNNSLTRNASLDLFSIHHEDQDVVLKNPNLTLKNTLNRY